MSILFRFKMLAIITDINSEHKLGINAPKQWVVNHLHRWLKETHARRLLGDKQAVREFKMLRDFNAARAKYKMPPHMSDMFFLLAEESPILLELVCFPADIQRRAGVSMLS